MDAITGTPGETAAGRKHGIDPACLKAVGWGEEYLKLPDDPASAANRRVEIIRLETPDTVPKIVSQEEAPNVTIEPTSPATGEGSSDGEWTPAASGGSNAPATQPEWTPPVSGSDSSTLESE